MEKEQTTSTREHAGKKKKEAPGKRNATRDGIKKRNGKRTRDTEKKPWKNESKQLREEKRGGRLAVSEQHRAGSEGVAG